MVYTDKELIDELNRVSDEHCDNERPSVNDMEKYGNISSSTFRNRFGSWSEALEASGLSNRQRNNKRIKKEKLKEEIHRLSNEYCEGETPSQKTNTEHGEYCIPTYRDRFGSWNEAVKCCGYEPNVFRGASNDEILEEIENVSEKFCDGETPRHKDMKEHGKWSVDIYIGRFGTWSKAVKRVGFEPNTPYEFIKSGSDSPNWIENKGYGDSWKQQKKKCLERDNYRCRVCLKTEKEIGKKPSVHHIKPRRMWDVQQEHEEMNSLSNLVCLCVSCHRKIEGEFINSTVNGFIEKSRELLSSEKP